MDKPIQVLILEDADADAELVKRELRKAGLDFTARWAQDKPGFLQALETFVPDIILADYSLPGFDGMAAMALARQKFPTVPVILVSGAIGEELAIESLKGGATDYVLKQRLRRLGPVVERALQEAERLAEKNRAEQALRESEERFRLLIEGIKDHAIFMLDCDGRVTTWNVAAQRLNGYASEEILGQHFSRFYPEADVAAGKPQRELAIAAEQGWYAEEGRRVRRDGSHFWASATITAVRDESGKLRGFAKITRDITERKRIEEELREAKAAAEAANQAKSRFLANISHELRTPMSAILGMTELALCEELDPQVRDQLETAKDSADVLLALLNEILDFSRMEAGRFTLDLAPFPVRRTLHDTMKGLSVRAEEKGLELACEIAPDLPDHLVGDGLRLRQILVNLVGNAIKFTDQGGVMVRVNVETKAAEEVCLRVAVSDTGIGIAPGDRERIFAPFAQADTSNTRRHGGTGLGLAITQNLVHLMGGRLWLESQMGQGSTFYFTARFALTPAALPEGDDPSRPRAEPLPPVRPLRILLAEDTRANQKLIVSILAKRGHAVEVAPDGQAALDLLDKQDFDLVLMDVQMPVMDGFQATEAIRALERNGKRRTPIIAMTAHAMRGDEERCLGVGMDDYLAKPIDRWRLIERVERQAGEG